MFIDIEWSKQSFDDFIKRNLNGDWKKFKDKCLKHSCLIDDLTIEEIVELKDREKTKIKGLLN